MNRGGRAHRVVCMESLGEDTPHFDHCRRCRYLVAFIVKVGDDRRVTIVPLHP